MSRDGSQARLTLQSACTRCATRALLLPLSPARPGPLAARPGPPAAHAGALSQLAPGGPPHTPPREGLVLTEQGDPEQDSTATSHGQGRARQPAPSPRPRSPSANALGRGPRTHSLEAASSSLARAHGTTFCRRQSMAAGGLPGTAAGDTGSSGPADKHSVIRTVTAPANPRMGTRQAGRPLPTRRCSKDLET